MKAFILMPFVAPIDGYYEHIFKPALQSAGYKVTRADDLFAPRPIILDIQESIRDADLVLCEMTGKNPNVFYELGLAHALGKSAILLSRREDDIPFDLRHIRVIIYDPNEAGWEQSLRSRITVAAKAARDSTPSWPEPLLPQRDPGGQSGQTSKRQNKSRIEAFRKEGEIVLVRFARKDGRVVSGPYPYRFFINDPHIMAILIEAKIWACQNTYENVIQILVNDQHIGEIRQAYEQSSTVRIELGRLETGRHTIAFDAHYEGIGGQVIKEELNEAGRYWILRQMVIVGEAISKNKM